VQNYIGRVSYLPIRTEMFQLLDALQSNGKVLMRLIIEKLR
jgi:hypothetical protein